MAIMKDQEPSKFDGEKVVYNCIKNNLPDNVIAYYNREINGYEFDFCLLLEGIGLLVIEVKGWAPTSIIRVDSPDQIYTTMQAEPFASPKKQARGYRFGLLNAYNNKYNINPLIMDMVCYPFMSKQDYMGNGLKIVSEPEFTLFKEDIESPQAFAQKVARAYQQLSFTKHDKMDSMLLKRCRSYFEASIEESEASLNDNSYSVLTVIPDGLDLNDIDVLINSYLKGIKQFVFVSNIAEVNALAKNLSLKLKNNGVGISGMNLQLSGHDSTIAINNNKFGIFGFDCFCIDNLSELTPKRISVNNGDFSPSDEVILEKLGRISDFNYQQYVVEHALPNKNIQVKAGAGTGKTFSMVSRIAFICDAASKSGVLNPADEIAMLTFTTDAASNMKSRLKALFLNYFILTKNSKYLSLIANIEQMRVSTIHSFANEIMKNTSISLGLGTDFATISGIYDKQKILNQNFNVYLAEKCKDDPTFLMDSKVNIYDLKKLLMDFAAVLYRKGCDIKETDISSFGSPMASLPFFNELIERVIKKTEVDYSEFLVQNNAVSLNEYMFYLNRCINDDSFNSSRYKYKYVFIDEFQDVDDSQIFAFLAMQRKLGFNFFIVGDLKQSIYRFRGATMDAFTKMGCEGDTWLRFTLNSNYRTDTRLLNQFDVLFNSMGSKNLIPYSRGLDSLIGVKNNHCATGDLVKKIEYTKEEIENEDFYKKIFESIVTRKDELESLSKEAKLSNAERTIAILTRTNMQVRAILQKAKEYDILVESDSNGDLFRIQPSIDLCKLTGALCNPYNVATLYDLITSNNVNVEFSVNSIAGLSEQEKVDVFSDCLDKYYQSTMQMSWSDLIAAVQEQPVLMMLRNIYEATMPWKSYSIQPERQLYYRNNYDLVFEQLSAVNKNSYLTLESINEDLHLLVSIGTEEKSRELIDSNENIKVICTTVHKSKGLEYDTVVLPYTTDSIDELKRTGLDITYVDGKVGYCFPVDGVLASNDYFYTENEIQEVEMEESRILYVALTRAINKFIWFEKTTNDKESWGKILEDLPCQ